MAQSIVYTLTLLFLSPKEGIGKCPSRSGIPTLDEIAFGQKLIDILQLLIQLEQLKFEEAFSKAQLAILLTPQINVLQRLSAVEGSSLLKVQSNFFREN